MVSPFGIDPGGNLLVAIQALFVGDLFSQDMTFHTVGHPFEVRMGFCQIPRAQLCKKRSCSCDQEQEKWQVVMEWPVWDFPFQNFAT